MPNISVRKLYKLWIEECCVHCDKFIAIPSNPRFVGIKWLDGQYLCLEHMKEVYDAYSFPTFNGLIKPEKSFCYIHQSNNFQDTYLCSLFIQENHQPRAKVDLLQYKDAVPMYCLTPSKFISISVKDWISTFRVLIHQI
jgi:hypothetical protein